MKNIKDCNMSYKIKTEAFVGLEYRDIPNDKNIVIDFSLIVEKPCFIELDKKNHTFICASSGSGKSYLGGVIAEESIRLMKNDAKPTSFLMIDRLGIFPTLDKPNTSDLVNKWNEKTKPFYQIIPKGLTNVEIWIPMGEQAKYHPDMYHSVFAIKPRNLSVYVFNYIFNIGENDPQSNLLKKCLNTLKKEKKDFTMNDLTRLVPEKQNEFGFKPQTGDALFSKLEALIEMGVVDNELGIDLDAMIKPGIVTIMDVSSCNPKTAKTVINILMDYIVNEQTRINQSVQLAKRFDRKVYCPNQIPPVHILIDEAHNFFPKNEIFQKAIKEGRNLGIKITAISQSPDLVDDLYENISHLFIGLMNADKSINYIRSFLPFSEKLQGFKDSVKGLNNGCFIYYNMKLKTKQRIRVRPRQSLHTAITEIEDYSPYLLDKPEEFSIKKIEHLKTKPVIIDPKDSMNEYYSDPIELTEHDKEVFAVEEIKAEDIKFVDETKVEPIQVSIDKPIIEINTEIKPETITEPKKDEPTPELPKIESKPEPIKETPKEIKSPVKETNAVTFKENYSKQNNQNFPTIRLNNSYKEGKVYFVRFPSKTGNAKCTFTHSKKLAEIPDEFLVKDTDTKTREEAITHLKKYYPDLKAETKCYISVFCWVQYLPKDDKARKEVLQEA